MSLQPRTLKLKNNFINTYNAFAEKHNLNLINNLNEAILTTIYEEVLTLRLDKYYNNLISELITELLKVLHYSTSYTKNELRASLNKIEVNIQIIERDYLKPEDKSKPKRETVGKKIKAINSNKSNKKENSNKDISTVKSQQSSNESSLRTINGLSKLNNDTPTSELYELLQNISDKSKEAIMNPDEFSDVKDYLHIETDIQRELEEVVKKVNTSDKNQLIILCGNVGDGKSHLISYLRDKQPEWFSDVTIYNDATESNHPSRTAIETLEEGLSSFNDLNIDTSTEKMILAINIGVLNNFINEMNSKRKYQKLINFLNDTTLYKSDGITRSEDSKIHIVSFFEHSNIKLMNNEVESPFYEELFERLFSNTESNIFYRAYLKDKSTEKYNIVHYNYELMLNKNIKEKILFILYRIQIQYNVIISIRALNNFIYDILVPNGTDKLQYSEFLPFLLFDSQNDSEIFRAVRQLDPVLNINNSMNKKFNTINIAYYNSNNYLKTTKRLIDDEATLNSFENFINTIDRLPMDKKAHSIYIKSYLRMLYLFETNKNITDENFYSEYIELLNATQKFQEKERDGSEIIIDRFRQLVIDTIKKWNGSFSEKSIFIDNDMDSSIATAVNLNLTFSSIKRENYSITIEFKETYRQLKHQLMIDFNLFKLLKKVNYGYILKNHDKKENVYFQQFMNSIIYKTSSLESTVIIDKDTNKRYELVDNGFSIEIN